MNHSKKMLIGLHLGNGYGSQSGAWRMPWVDPTNYTSFDARVRQAQAAERGKFQFIFLPDRPSAVADIANEPPHFNLDVMMTLAAVARSTERIGLVATGAKVDMDVGTTTSIVKGMEVAELVVRERDPSEKRRVFVSLTR